MSFDRLNVYINHGTKYLLRKNRIFRRISSRFRLFIPYAIDIIAKHKQWDTGDGVSLFGSIRERKMRNRKFYWN